MLSYLFIFLLSTTVGLQSIAQATHSISDLSNIDADGSFDEDNQHYYIVLEKYRNQYPELDEITDEDIGSAKRAFEGLGKRAFEGLGKRAFEGLGKRAFEGLGKRGGQRRFRNKVHKTQTPFGK